MIGGGRGSPGPTPGETGSATGKQHSRWKTRTDRPVGGAEPAAAALSSFSFGDRALLALLLLRTQPKNCAHGPFRGSGPRTRSDSLRPTQYLATPHCETEKLRTQTDLWCARPARAPDSRVAYYTQSAQPRSVSSARHRCET